VSKAGKITKEHGKRNRAAAGSKKKAGNWKKASKGPETKKRRNMERNGVASRKKKKGPGKEARSGRRRDPNSGTEHGGLKKTQTDDKRGMNVEAGKGDHLSIVSPNLGAGVVIGEGDFRGEKRKEGGNELAEKKKKHSRKPRVVADRAQKKNTQSRMEKRPIKEDHSL